MVTEINGGIALVNSTLVILGRVFPEPAKFGPIVYLRADVFLFSEGGSFYIEMENPLASTTAPLGTYDFQEISLLETRGSSDIHLYGNSLDILSLKFVGKDYNIPIGNYFYLFSPSSVTAGSIILIQSLGINVFRRFVNSVLNFPQDTLVNNYTSIHTDVRDLPDVGFLIGTEGTIKPQGIAPRGLEVTGPYIALLSDHTMIATTASEIVLPKGYNGQIMVVLDDSSHNIPITYTSLNGTIQTFTATPGTADLASKDRWYAYKSTMITSSLKWRRTTRLV